MKRTHKVTFILPLINILLVTYLVVSGAMLYLLSQKSYPAISQQTAFQIVLVNFTFLLIILVSVNFLLIKIRRRQIKDRHSFDGLTGVMSRQNFVHVFEHILLENPQSVQPLCLLMIDVDHFKRINEEHGYQTGDHILTTLGKSIQSTLRAPDIICRWSGDKFLVVLKNCTEKNACRIAAKILLVIRQQEMGFEQKTIRVTGSIGIAQMMEDDTVKELIARAENGLTKACNGGRNTCAVA